MCDPRVSTRHSWRPDVAKFLPPRIELSEPGHNRPVLRCSGELDGTVGQRLATLLDAACEREIEVLLLDLSEVDFIDGRILALIKATRVRLDECGASLRIVAGGQPLRLLRVTGVGDGDAAHAPRFEAWHGPSSSSSSPTTTSARPGATATR